MDADDYRGLTAIRSGGSVILYAVRRGGSGPTGGGELVRLVDNSGYNGTFSGTPTLLATAAANTAFRGVAFAPGTGPTPVTLRQMGGVMGGNAAALGFSLLAITVALLLTRSFYRQRGYGSNRFTK